MESLLAQVNKKALKVSPTPNPLTKCSYRSREICVVWQFIDGALTCTADLWNVTCTLDQASSKTWKKLPELDFRCISNFLVVDPLNSFASSSPVGIPWKRTFIEWPLFSDFRNLSLCKETKQHDLLERATIWKTTTQLRHTLRMNTYLVRSKPAKLGKLDFSSIPSISAFEYLLIKQISRTLPAALRALYLLLQGAPCKRFFRCTNGLVKGFLLCCTLLDKPSSDESNSTSLSLFISNRSK